MKPLNEIQLNKPQRQLLKRAISLVDKDCHNRVLVEDIMKYKEFDELYFTDLIQLDLVQFTHIPTEDEDRVFHVDNGFIVNQRGLHYFDFHWQRVKDFWFRSVLIPIIVAFVTSLITTLIGGLLR